MLKAFLIGNLTRDPEMRSTQQGTPVCSFTVAVNKREGEQKADFVRCTTWRGLAENCNRYLRKGNKVGVSGTLTLQNYTGKDGAERYSLEVQADEVEFLTPKTAPETPGEGFVPVDDDSDLPF